MKTKYHLDERVGVAAGEGKVKGNVVQEGGSPTSSPHVGTWC